MPHDFVVVGAGFTGATVAQRVSQAGHSVLVVDNRNCVGGTSADNFNVLGQLSPSYGPHAFHTNSQRVWDYLSHFTKWKDYTQVSLTRFQGDLFEIPINANTIEKFYDKKFESQEDVQRFLKSKTRHVSDIQNSRQLGEATMGHELFNAFYSGYTFKQWNMDAAELHRNVIGRLPVRTNRDNRYFTDKYQALPTDGYTSLIANMLSSVDDIQLGVTMSLAEAQQRGKFVIWTAPIDEAFECRHGSLPWRSLRWESIISDKPQEAAVIHEADVNVPWTRTTDVSYFSGKSGGRTELLREFSTDNGEKFYPILEPGRNERLDKYLFLARNTARVAFLGRMGSYKYINMDQAVSGALAFTDSIGIKAA